MKVLIVAKTRQGNSACVGGISAEGKSVRLLPPNDRDERWGMAFDIGDVWEVEGERPRRLAPPHIEDLVVTTRRKLKSVTSVVPTILKFMPPRSGGPDIVFDAKPRIRSNGALYFSAASGVPSFSTAFWRPDQPLHLDSGGKRLRYVYPSPEGVQSLVYVGFQEPVREIPAGTLVRVSLAHWWRPDDRPEVEVRSYVQVSGWYREEELVHAQFTEETAAPNVSVLGPADYLCRARSELARVFGYRELRPLQEEIVRSVLDRKDTLGIMPTGAGKSLCYQLPAIVSTGLTVVVSPLLSLMQDQIDQLRQAGVSAVTLNSQLDYSDYQENMRRVRSGHAKLLYLAPETLVRPEIQVLLEESRLSLFTIDEAHCISEWGHDFRPEYRQLKDVRKRYPRATCLALTATATERVREDIRTTLGMSPKSTFIAGFDRPNLYLEVQRRGPNLTQLNHFLAAHQGEPGIIYCSTRGQVDRLTEQLAVAGIDALPYHAGLDDSVRRENQRRFQRDDVQVIVATIAFGMGINKSNVRFVVHCTLPECIETYYQQIGRAGRDGVRADCLLLFGRQDIGTIMRFIEDGAESEREGRMSRMQAMIRYAEATVCRRSPLLTYFGDPVPEEPCGMCDNCLAEAAGRTEIDVSEDARLFLTCIQQTRQMFGVTHVVDVLRGSSSARLLRWKHDQVASYGSGKHRSKEEWRALADRLLERGLLEAEMEHGTLRITDAGRRVLQGECVLVPEIVVAPAPLPPVRGTVGREANDPILFETLRRLRKELADEAKVPPYVVFSDRTLIDIVARLPQSLGEFARVHGVGEKKLAVYGAQFLDAIGKYLEENPASKRKDLEDAAWFSAGKKRYLEVAAAYLEGASLAEIASRWEIKPSTILNHLYEYVKSGGSLDADRVLSECRLKTEEQAEALRLFGEGDNEYLGPVREAMGGVVSYDDLRLVRLYRTLMKRNDH